MKLRDILKHLEAYAPLSLAYGWDNCGLLIGDAQMDVQKVFVCLDVTPRAVDLALEAGADLIVSHHPVIFKPLARINNPVILKLIQSGIAVISMHTNLDMAPRGVNHALAAALGLEVMEPLSLETGESWHHVSVTVPEDYAHSLREAVFSAGAGVIGKYDSCSTMHHVSGSFRSLPGSDPFIRGEGLQEVQELELEFMVDAGKLSAVLKAIQELHPYQTPAIYHFPVANANPAYGLGLICKSEEPLDMTDLLELCRQRLQTPNPKLWTAGRDANAHLDSIAICGGSGASLTPLAAAKADILISGDFGYHQLLDSPIPIIDAGHFYTEYPVLWLLAEWLKDMNLDALVMKMQEHEWELNRE